MTTKHKILVVDDEKIFAQGIASHLRGRSDRAVLTAQTLAEATDILAASTIDIVLLDQNLPDGRGVDLCEPILEHNDDCKIIFVTAFPSFENAVQAIKVGAYDYLSKPVDLEAMELAVNRALRRIELERIERVETYRHRKEEEACRLVGSDRSLREIRLLIDRAAQTSSPVLITGETGTGKNVVAKAIHYAGPRKPSPFVSVNCAAMPDQLIEAELFGHRKGAFTGATATRRGVFEMADGGTLFLDEIGTMPLDLQAKLLGVLESHRLRRLGDERERVVDVRALAATNTDLELAVDANRFRRDLFFRLNVIPIRLPPLRERVADIPRLCSHFISELAASREVSLAPGEIERLSAYSWPGNVRELRNIIERALVLQRGAEISPSAFLLADSIGAGPGPVGRQAPAEGHITPLREVERRHIIDTFERLSRNYTRTARALGISINTLKRKLQRYGLR